MYYVLINLHTLQAGRKEPSENLERAIDNMTKKTRDLRRQVGDK